MSDKCILVILGHVNSPEIVLADDDWIQDRARALHVPDGHDAFDWLEKAYKAVHVIDSREEVAMFCNDYTGHYRDFVCNRVAIFRDELE